MIEQKKISVIIPFYKEFDLLPRALNSVFCQALPQNWILEVVIGNDSDYENWEVEERLGLKNLKIKFAKNQESHGAGNARNAALKAATGDYYAFLDADDYWTADKLISQCRSLDCGATFVATAYKFEGQSFDVTPPCRVNGIVDMLIGSIGTSTIVVAKKLMHENFFSDRKFSQDTELWAKLCGSSSFSYSAIMAVGAIYCPSDRTSNKFKQLQYFSVLLSDLKLNIIAIIYILFRYIMRGAGNYFFKKLIYSR